MVLCKSALMKHGDPLNQHLHVNHVNIESNQKVVSWCCRNYCWLAIVFFDVGIVQCLSNLLYYTLW